MYRIGGFCHTSFASLGMKFYTVIYLSLSITIIAIYNSSEFPSKQLEGINFCIGCFFSEKATYITPLGITLLNFSSWLCLAFVSKV